jgi:hypothetical protein
MRRLQREQQAHIESTLNDPQSEDWKHVGPLLDEAMAQLNEKDRDAIVLRFFEGKALKEVGRALGASEDAAKMRVNRALDKLRDFFNRRGITVSTGALAGTIAENSIQAAPASLAASVAAHAAQASATALSTLTTVKGAIQMMTSAKISVVIGLGAATIIALQAHQVSVQKQSVKALQEQVAQAGHPGPDDQALQAEIAKLQEENAAYARTIDAMQLNLAKARAHASDALTAKSDALAAAARAKSNPLGNMFNDPATLDAMRPAQLATAKLMYAPLIKQLNLSPDEADKFYNIIVDNGLKVLKAMQSGSAEEIKSNTQSLETELASLLGDAGYAQYQSFVKNDMADHTMFAAMKNDFANDPLSGAQQQQLLQAMKSARESATPDNPLDLSHVNPADKTAVMAQAVQQNIQRQQQINQNVLQLAAAFLSPEQLQTLSTSQSNMLATQKAMAPMMQKMLGTPPADQ